MSVPRFRLACCLCRKPIPLSTDVYALDAEWQRRYPAMLGILACQRCALSTGWSSCKGSDGVYADGHIPAARARCDVDAWSHVLGMGTHIGMVQNHPRSALLQGAEPYLRHLAQRPRVAPAVALRLRAILDEWDAAPSTDRVRPTGGVAPCESPLR
ncbi:hypothetical protein ACFZBU_39335 [Embleya sp. NPDC008237]|uniref:hypothetical protein n=1 Tax=Embleya sp. NPDC008237 TaxID=3363978 RepID=UPI0036E40114